MIASAYTYVPIYGDGIHGKNPHPGHLIALFDLKARRHRVSSGPSPGPRASAVWSRIMNDTPPPWPTCIVARSSASCSSRPLT